MDFELMKASNLQLYIRVDFATQGFNSRCFFAANKQIHIAECTSFDDNSIWDITFVFFMLLKSGSCTSWP